MKKNNFIIALRLLIVMTFFLGVAYPVFMTLLSKTIFPEKSAGSMIIRNDTIIGSKLIGQKFSSGKYFHSRPSAVDYNPLPSGASNLGLISDTLKKYIRIRKEEFISQNYLEKNAIIPNDIICASGSGLDPNISPESALLQIERIGFNRGFTPEEKFKLMGLIEKYTEQPQLGFLGDPVINVVQLNLALDNLK
jgi:potassium-transporting ATPase KdpC subunit